MFQRLSSMTSLETGESAPDDGCLYPKKKSIIAVSKHGSLAEWKISKNNSFSMIIILQDNCLLFIYDTQRWIEEF